MYQCDWCEFFAQQQGGANWEIYRGIKNQKGYNIFSTYFHRYGVPMLKWIGRKALETGREWVRDVVLHDEPPKKALKKRLVKTARDAAMEGFDKLEKRIQSGSGAWRDNIVPIHRSIPYIGTRTSISKKKQKVKPSSKKKKKRNLNQERFLPPDFFKI